MASLRVLMAAGTYLALVLLAGFVLGTIRVLALVPWLGERTAELLELPMMIAVTVVSARVVVHRLALPPRPWPRLLCGGLAVVLLLALELVVVAPLRGLTPAQAITGRDPISGVAYGGALGLMALMPWLLSCRQGV